MAAAIALGTGTQAFASGLYINNAGDNTCADYVDFGFSANATGPICNDAISFPQNALLSGGVMIVGGQGPTTAPSGLAKKDGSTSTAGGSITNLWGFYVQTNGAHIVGDSTFVGLLTATSGLNAGASKVTNMGAGTVSAASTDAVNGSQLFTTNSNLTSLATSVGSLSNSLGSISTSVVSLSTGLGATNSTVASLSTSTSTSVGSLSTGLSTTNSNVSLVSTMVSTGLSTTNSNVASLSTSTSTSVGSISTGLSTTTSNVASMSTSVGSMSTSVGSTTTAISSLSTGLIATTSIMTSLSTAVAQGGGSSNGGLIAAGGGTSDTRQTQGGTANSTATVTIAASGCNVANGLDTTATGLCANAGSIAGRNGATQTTVANGATAYGSNSAALSENTTAVGFRAVAQYTGSVAIGFQARAIADPATAVGSNSLAQGNNSVALGASSQALGNNSVALGANSVAAEDNTVSIGAPGSERRITNVAAGVKATDAVNVQQLQSVQSNLTGQINNVARLAYSGAAMSMALSGTYAPPLEAGEHSVGIGFGTYQGYAAIAFNVKGLSLTGKQSWGVGVTTNGTTVGGNVGFGWKW